MKTLGLIFMLIVAASLRAETPSTQPSEKISGDNLTALEVRAHEEFNRANWSSAMPLLKQVAKQMRDTNQTDRLGSIEESIRVCEKNLKIATAAQNSAAAAPSNEQRKPHAPPKPGEVRDIEIKDLGNFDYDQDQGGNIPGDVKAMAGMTVRLRGFMIPMDQAQNITQFALVPSLFSCCFGQPPQVQHTIIVHAGKGKEVTYFPDEIMVEGKLSVEEKKEDGFIVSIFQIEANSVKPAGK